MSGHTALDSGSFFSYLNPELLLSSAALAHTNDTAVSSSDDKDPQSAAAEGHKPASNGLPTASRLLSRVLGKRKSIDLEVTHSPGRSQCPSTVPGASPAPTLSTLSRSPAASIFYDDDDLEVIGCKPHGSCASTRPNPHGLQHTFHEFVVPLQPPAHDNPPASKQQKKGKGKGRGTGKSKAKGFGRGACWNTQFETAPFDLPGGWRKVSVADILFDRSVSSSDNLGTQSLLPGAWSCEVRGSHGNVIKGMAAIADILGHAQLGALTPLVLQSSWPPDWDQWKELPDLENHSKRIKAGEEFERVCDCFFRAETAIAGPEPVGALRVKIGAGVLNLTAALLPLRPPGRFDGDAGEPGSRLAHRRFEWRADVQFARKTVGKGSKSKKKEQTDQTAFHLLDNKDDEMADQPPNFQNYPLRGEQLRSLKWMQMSEEQPRPFHLVCSEAEFSTEQVPERGIHPMIRTPTSFGWICRIRCRESYNIAGGILGDAVGYGKTATTIGLIDSRLKSHVQAKTPPSDEPYFFTSNATLILVPSNLLDQWLGECKKFVAPASDYGNTSKTACGPLRILAIKTATQLKSLTVGRICEETDVVLCSYRLFYSPVYRRRLLELSGNCEEMSQQSAVKVSASMRLLRINTKRFKTNPLEMCWKNASDNEVVTHTESLRFPVLEQFWWRRVVFDEFHELEASSSAQFDSLRNLCGSYRWGLTGTPPTRDVAQIKTMANLFHVGDFSVFPGELPRASSQSFLDHFARQNTSVEILPVELKEHVVDISQTPEERVIYLQALHDMGASETEAPVEKTQKLVRLCSHFSYGENVSADAGSECKKLRASKEKSFDKNAKKLANAAITFVYLNRLVPPPPADVFQSATFPALVVESAEEKLLVSLHSQYRMADEGSNDPTVVVADALPDFSIVGTGLSLMEVDATNALTAAAGGTVHTDAPIPTSVCSHLADSAPPHVGELLPTDTSATTYFHDGGAAPMSEKPTAEIITDSFGKPKEIPTTRRHPTLEAAMNALQEAKRMMIRELTNKFDALDAKTKCISKGGESLACELSKASSKAPVSLSFGPGPQLPSTGEVGEAARVALKDAAAQFEASVSAYDAAVRSRGFFDKVLAAMQGEGSEEHRSCSVCLDDDIPCEELSITACAHVFHSDCIREVAIKFSNCPECRQRLDVHKDITPLVSELAAPSAKSGGPCTNSNRACKKPRTDARSGSFSADPADSAEYQELSRSSGTKLAAIALRLREIISNGEKAIVFCQWEDLKKKVSDTLWTLGIAHFELSGNVYTRGEVIRRFQEERGEGSTSVLLLSLEHSASGTNLTAANHVVFVHPMCAESAERAVAYEAQAIGRCRRWGQERPEVHCWRFVTRGTVEENITRKHRKELEDTHLGATSRR